MATQTQSMLGSSLHGIQSLSLAKQLAMLVSLAASVALGVYIVLWSQAPNYVPIMPDLGSSNRGDAISILQLNNIPFQIEFQSGMILVDSSRVYEARMKLSQSGISSGDNDGFEILDKEGTFGDSQFVEQTKYIRGLQGELAKTISSIKNVRKARVHLAVPKSTPFLRNKSKTSASVFLELQGARTLDRGQVGAIVNLVAASVPGMGSEDVTVIDQNGRLLSMPGDDSLTLASRQMDYVRNVESMYSKRIEQLVTPLLGAGRVHAEVTAVYDFTEREETAENFDPKNTVIRSEKLSGESRGENSSFAGGVPGALSNQPPLAGSAPEKSKNAAATAANTSNSANVNQRNQSVRNYEVDRQIKHVKNTVGVLQRLSVAVLLDDKIEYGIDGLVSRKPLTEEQIKQITKLVKDAVGWDEKRGDVVSVLNSSFAKEAPPFAEAPVPFYEKVWFVPLIKQALGVIGVILLLFTVLRPAVKNLTVRGKEELEQLKIAQDPVKKAIEPEEPSKKIAVEKNKSEMQMIGDMITGDSKRAAQVVMDWVGKEE